MGITNLSPGPNAAAEYMVSGLPYVSQSSTVSGSVTAIEFPFVTNFFSIRNTGGGDLDVGFTRNGVLGTNKFTLAVSESFRADIRMKTLYLASGGDVVDYEVVASLTGIPHRSFPILTGALQVYSGSMQDSQFGNNGYGYSGIG